MMFRIAQISDTHLSGDKPFFVGNFECVARAVNAARSDLVLNTGDISLDGANKSGDLSEALRLHRVFDGRVRFIPGNHDVGDSPEIPGSKESPITDQRRQAFISVFGQDWWSFDVPGWRIVALNAQLFGSGLSADDEQIAFVERVVGEADTRKIVLFIHKPLFDQHDSEEVLGGRFLPPASRSRLWQAFGDRRPALIASGHVHQYRSTQSESVHCVWAPSAAYFIPDSRQPRYGLKQVGFVMHELHEDGNHQSRFVEASGAVDLNIADFPDAYGPMH
jgi:3',5'-cyclic AMP phosphodiesterase CpdA